MMFYPMLGLHSKDSLNNYLKTYPVRNNLTSHLKNYQQLIQQVLKSGAELSSILSCMYLRTN